MNVTRVSMMSGIEHTLDLPVTTEQLERYAQGGVLLQDVFPTLTPDEREFIKTGITPQEWDEMFAIEEEGEDEEVIATDESRSNGPHQTQGE